MKASTAADDVERLQPWTAVQGAVAAERPEPDVWLCTCSRLVLTAARRTGGVAEA